MKRRFINAGREKCDFDKYVAAPYFRKSFLVDFEAAEATVRICGLGFYHLFVNGKKITKGELAPYISNPDHFCYYDTYDIKKYIRRGENVIGIQLGNGFYNPFGGRIWDFDKADWAAAPCVAVECEVKNDAEVVSFCADESFKCNASPVYFDEYRMGTYYDARKEIEGWCDRGFDDTGWQPAKICNPPRGELKKCTVEPVIVRRKIRPVSITKTESGILYDFGENNAGVCELRIKGRRGQKITLWHCEMLEDGKFYNDNIIFKRDGFEYYSDYNQKDIYILSGNGEEVYSPSFTYHGFRYVLVQGLDDEQATKDLLMYLVMSSDIKEAGGFTCSDDKANKLCEMVKRSDISNFYYFPTDCPHREKNGWTGDASASAEHMILNYDTEKSLSEWLCNIRKAQKPDGSLPGIVPTAGWGYEWGNGPAWDSVLFNIPYELMRYRGNTEIVRENAAAMMAYLKYITGRKNDNGTVSVGLGDWCPVGKKSWEFDAPVEVTDSIMVMDMAVKCARMMRRIGLVGDAAYADKVSSDMRNAIRRELIGTDMLVSGNCQTSQAMGLYYGVFDSRETEEAFCRLKELIAAKDNCFDCGYLGMRVIFHVLSEYGEGEMAYEMITKDDYPSYAYLIKMGETTLCEKFDADRKMCGSHNHHFFGDVSHWFSERVAGLRVIDSKKLEIAPDFIERLSRAHAWYDLPDGRAEVSWRRTPDGIVLEVNSPVEFSVKLPQGYMRENGLIIKKQ